ncbi:hypothetical protein [Geotalea sp. SG265]|uniref:hypothetical protein n=1 Tax=Geotalea sp. SG265 TaxID=2922867 RepID=UPI001FAFB66F|nr:hypothetical protein [Geotalea sp. SG265]
MRKVIYIFTLFVLPFFSAKPLIAGSHSSDASKNQNIGLFSNFTVNGETGDCGGYELWLFKKDDSLYGQLAVYEGNCTAEKKKIGDVKYNSKTGMLSFKTAYYTNESLWIFKGILQSNTLSGTFSVVTKASKEKTFEDRVVLSKAP